MSLAEAAISISADVRLDDLAERLSYVDNDDLFDLIVLLDERVADWDFTKRLAEHFKAEEQKYEDEAEMGEVQP